MQREGQAPLVVGVQLGAIRIGHRGADIAGLEIGAAKRDSIGPS